MQDNDPKHASRVAKAFLAENGVNWWQTPPESPDTNPIENLWHELKVSETYSELPTYDYISCTIQLQYPTNCMHALLSVTGLV